MIIQSIDSFSSKKLNTKSTLPYLRTNSYYMKNTKTYNCFKKHSMNGFWFSGPIANINYECVCNIATFFNHLNYLLRCFVDLKYKQYYLQLFYTILFFIDINIIITHTTVYLS